MKWPRELRRAARTARLALRTASGMVSAARDIPVSRAAKARQPAVTPGQTAEITAFGSNPGRLRMLMYCPPKPPRRGAPVVVVLHGCGQDAARFAAESGWTALAARLGFPLVLPEQPRENNHGGCFNWYRASAVRRGRGEVLSIRQMVAFATRQFRADPGRVFVVGFSAGGAIAAALLAAYPDVFAAGAVVAGLPVGCASNETEAFLRMSRAGPIEPGQASAARVVAAAPTGFRGKWPRLSIWRGEMDRVVDPANGALLARQWTAVHGLDFDKSVETAVNSGATRRIWGDPDGPEVELWTLRRLAHAFPIHGTGRASEWVMQARLSAVHRMARFFDLR